MPSSYKEICEEYGVEYDFYKEKDTDKIWWLETYDLIGPRYFSFDKKEIFSLFGDYPNNLTPEQKKNFDKENPYWKKFFKH